MKYRRSKKVVAAAALVLTGFGLFDATAGAVCKPRPETSSPHASPYDALCRIPTACKKG